MPVCDFCNEKFSELLYTCKRCNGSFCYNHRLLENHNCIAMDYGKCPKCGGTGEVRVTSHIHRKVIKKPCPRCKPEGPTPTPLPPEPSEERCYYCDREIKKGHFCSYCKKNFCKSHKKPEKHDCRYFEPTTPIMSSERKQKPLNKIYRGFVPILKISVVLFFLLSLTQPELLKEKSPDVIKEPVDKVVDSLVSIKERIADKLEEFIWPSTTQTTLPQTTPPTTIELEKIEEPKIVLDPLPPGYHDKYEISDSEYGQRKFPMPNPKTYAFGIVGKYGKGKYKHYEREKKIYAFEFEKESSALEFFELFDERVRRNELTPKIIEITPIKLHFRHTQQGQYNGVYFQLKNVVYYLKMEFSEAKDLEFIKQNFFGVKIVPSPTTTTSTTLLPETLAPTPTVAPLPEFYNFEKRVFELINEERVKHDLGLLEWDDRIANAARKHSTDMGINNYFEHDSIDGRILKDRLQEEKIHFSGYGENIAMHPEASVIHIINGIEYPEYLSQEEIAQGLVAGWMESPGHRANILTGWFRTTGIGIYYSNGYYYATQDFVG